MIKIKKNCAIKKQNLFNFHWQELPLLEDLLFVGNPLFESMEESVWKAEASKRLPNLKKLDGEPVITEDAPQMVQPPFSEAETDS